MSDTIAVDPLEWFAETSERVWTKQNPRITIPAHTLIRMGLLLAVVHPEWAAAYSARYEAQEGRRAPTAAIDAFVQMFPMRAETEEPDASAGLDRG